MGYSISIENSNTLFQSLSDKYDIYAPTVFEGEGCFSDTDSLRYGKVKSFDEIEFERKSEYSFKEVLIPVRETLFYFAENQTIVPEEDPKGAIIFVRSCDLHAIKRLDQMYLKNGASDFYYARRRNKVKFAILGCEETCQSGFCVSMGTNTTDAYDFSFEMKGNAIVVDCKDEELKGYFESVKKEECEVTPAFVTENIEKVTLPKNLSNESFDDELWEEYGSRCINCGRCNFVCPTCTCFSMQDIFYKDNHNAGERRRVWASCQVDGYTDMAGGHSFRKKQGERMRFKVMHKIHDFNKRFGYDMCVGCGRCDDACPQYISFSECIDKVKKVVNEEEK